MNLNTLRQFRHDLYDCCPRAKDALFTTMDALITQTQARSLPELSQSPSFERRWSSIYEVLLELFSLNVNPKAISWYLFVALQHLNHQMWVSSQL